VNIPFKGQFRSGDVDILDSLGNVHSVGGVKRLSEFGEHFQYLRQFVAQSANPSATITYWYEGPINSDYFELLRIAQRWGVAVEVIP